MFNQKLSVEERTFWLRWVLAGAAGWAVLLAVAMGGAWIGFGTATIGSTTASGATTSPGSGLENLAVIGVVIVFFAGGAVIGTVQWLVLRQRIKGAAKWILVSSAGWLIGFTTLGRFASAAARPIRNSIENVAGPVEPVILVVLFVALFWGIFGAASGSMQWLVMQRWVNRSAGRWLAANVVGGLLAGAAGTVVGLAVVGLLGGAGFGAAAEAISGLVGGDSRSGAIGGAGVVAVAGIVGGATGGAVVGAVTGFVLVWLLRHIRPKARLNASKIDRPPDNTESRDAV